MTNTPPHWAFIDALRALASQLIVLHHLAIYGPMADAARPLAPQLFTWLGQEARLAVQVFFVIGGFLATKSLAPNGFLTAVAPLKLLGRRYLILGIPCLTAVLLSVVCAAAARTLMADDAIPSAPTVSQVFAHAFFLQSILGFDSLSAGVWYVAVDFQLFAVLLGCLWLARHTSGTSGASDHAGAHGLFLVVMLALASLFYFNRHPEWDCYAVYFFGAYALGVLAYWIAGCRNALPWALLLVVIVGAALQVDWRSRLVVALVTALALGLSRRHEILGILPQLPGIVWLGKISYSIFLVHFPICLVVNGLFARFIGSALLLNAAGLVFTWWASIAAGALFYRLVECRVRLAAARPASPVSPR